MWSARRPFGAVIGLLPKTAEFISVASLYKSADELRTLLADYLPEDREKDPVLLCIYSSDGEFVCGDGYWNENGFRHWKIVRLADGAVRDIGDFFVPAPYREPYSRCDLHPRWRRDGGALAFNSVHEGSRQIYLIDRHLPDEAL